MLPSSSRAQQNLEWEKRKKKEKARNEIWKVCNSYLRLLNKLTLMWYPIYRWKFKQKIVKQITKFTHNHHFSDSTFSLIPARSFVASLGPIGTVSAFSSITGSCLLKVLTGVALKCYEALIFLISSSSYLRRSYSTFSCSSLKASSFSRLIYSKSSRFLLRSWLARLWVTGLVSNLEDLTGFCWTSFVTYLTG